MLPVRPIEPVPGEELSGSATDDVPELGLSEDVFSDEITQGDVEPDGLVAEPEAPAPPPAPTNSMAEIRIDGDIVDAASDEPVADEPASDESASDEPAV